jgi:two-component system, chemotaxis family, chemotaxis protein CheV
MSKGTLLEAGTNEMELLLFRVGATRYGINVAKVREIIRMVKTISIPHAPEAIEGSFKLREEVLTLINLKTYLDGKEPVILKADIAAAQAAAQEKAAEGDGEAAPEEADSEKAYSLQDDYRLIIVIELNDIRCGVLVDAVEMIHRLRWDQIEPPSAYIASHGTPITAVARIEEQVVLVLDFETIVGSLLGSGGVDVPLEEKENETPEYKDLRLLVADDSVTIRQSVRNVLKNAGFEHITICGDGQEAWEHLEKGKAAGDVPFDMVLTDIEMPRMDGLHLTARIKEDPDLKSLPVVLFSSLVRSDTVTKHSAVGADAQVTKFKKEELLKAIDSCLEKMAAQS